jgi:hypothetical protein
MDGDRSGPEGGPWAESGRDIGALHWPLERHAAFNDPPANTEEAGALVDEHLTSLRAADASARLPVRVDDAP